MPKDDFGLFVATETGLLETPLLATVFALSLSSPLADEKRREFAGRDGVVVLREASETVGVFARIPMAVAARGFGAADDLSAALGLCPLVGTLFVAKAGFGGTENRGEGNGVLVGVFLATPEVGSEIFLGAGFVAGGGIDADRAFEVLGLEITGFVAVGLVGIV